MGTQFQNHQELNSLGEGTSVEKARPSPVDDGESWRVVKPKWLVDEFGDATQDSLGIISSSQMCQFRGLYIAIYRNPIEKGESLVLHQPVCIEYKIKVS